MNCLLSLRVRLLVLELEVIQLRSKKIRYVNLLLFIQISYSNWVVRKMQKTVPDFWTVCLNMH